MESILHCKNHSYKINHKYKGIEKANKDESLLNMRKSSIQKSHK